MPATIVKRLSTALLSLVIVSIGSAAANAEYLLVTDELLDRVVRFDITTGASNLFATYPIPSSARALAVDGQGNVYSSTHTGHENVVKFIPQPGTDVLTAVDFTAKIGDFGPGQIQFYKGDLYVAGGSTAEVRQFNGVTGAPVRQFSVTGSSRFLAMTIAEDKLYYAELFQDRVRKMDLTQNPPTGGTLLLDLNRLSDPIVLTIGGNGHLFVVGQTTGNIQEYNAETGAFVRTFVDQSVFGIPEGYAIDKGMVYDAASDTYFVSVRDTIYRFDSQGALLSTYQSDLLRRGYGMVIVPEPSTYALAAVGMVALLAIKRRKAQA